jgi:hypothetical protein
MNVNIDSTGAVNISAALSQTGEHTLSVESNFDTKQIVLLSVGVTEPVSNSDYEAKLMPNQESNLSFRVVSVPSGSSLWGKLSDVTLGDSCNVRVAIGV